MKLLVTHYFQTNDFDSFRQYLIRANTVLKMTQIGKGVYYIGKNPIEEDIQKAIVDFYVDNNYGMLPGLSLLYKYRLIEDAPSYVEIKCLSKAIGNNKIIPTKTMITNDNRSFRELIEILSQQTKIECIENYGILFELVKGYKDEFITTHILAEFNQITFVRLEKVLNTARI